MGTGIRSGLYLILQILITPPYSIIAILTFPFSPLTRYRVIALWARFFVWLAGALCGVRYRVEGAHHIPTSPCVLLSKHQSAWETLAYQEILPPHVMVLKRELLRIPFFGWGLAMLSPIAIDRATGKLALKQVLEEGPKRLSAGLYVTMYPEGTRIAPGQRGRYRVGGASLAAHAGVPIIPIAHNAGYVWPRKSFLKHPGLITVSIGPPIETAGRTPEALIHDVETWIEAECERLGSSRGKRAPRHVRPA
jgi:1-acyl-sn-glycerol-3-phosphate acyltransferase